MRSVLGWVRAIVTLAAFSAATVAHALPPGAFVALCYHEVRDDVRDYPDPYAVDSSALVAQFEWLRGNGYTPVSLQEIVAARSGGKPLPDKAVLLTFDDAYLSFYTRVYPLLREFRYPALLGVVGKWIDEPQGAAEQYGEKGSVPAASFPTWGQLREMAASGLVELSSHSYDLHRGTLANPQGNLQPVGTSRLYAAGTYEGDASWLARVRDDLQRNSSTIERETGRRPRAVVWPYGSYNNELVRIAAELGMPIALTLEDGPNTADVPLAAVRRILIAHNPTLPEFAAAMRGPQDPQPVRVVEVSLDDVYSADPQMEDRNLSVLLERIKTLAPSHVYLQAYSDPAGAGQTEALYFPNRHLTMRADLFSRVAWQLATRAEVKIFAMLPPDALRLPASDIAEIYADLARHASFNGLVFMREGPLAAEGTARYIEFTRQLAERAGAWRAPLRIVRGIRADSMHALLNDASLAQALAEMAASSDHVAVSSPPERAGVDFARAAATLQSLVPGARSGRSDTGKLLVLLRPGEDDAAGERLALQMRALQLNGVLNFGYHRNRFAADQPPLARIAPAMSLRTYPR